MYLLVYFYAFRNNIGYKRSEPIAFNHIRTENRWETEYPHQPALIMFPS